MPVGVPKAADLCLTTVSGNGDCCRSGVFVRANGDMTNLSGPCAGQGGAARLVKHPKS